MHENIHASTTGWYRMNCLHWLFALLLVITVPNPLVSQDSEKVQLLEVVVTTNDAARTETLIYLRVFSDGSAEAHPTRKVDFRNLVLKQAQIPSPKMVKLQEFLSPVRTQSWDSTYERFWGNKDFGDKWAITIGQGREKKEITLVNFRPFLAREKKKPYPTDIEKLGCTVWELRESVLDEPLERNYIKGCKDWGY
jgi:hypothetical protein